MSPAMLIDGNEISTEGTSLKNAERWIELALEKQAELEGRAEVRKQLEDGYRVTGPDE
jgi:hypothetical protein